MSPGGLLDPLPIRSKICTEITLDFIEGLPRSQGPDVIMVAVDCLSKYAHFIALPHPYTAASIARLFLNHIFKLHEMPKSVVTDRDPTFTSSFWLELFRLQGAQLYLSSAFHPQSDGKFEVVNWCLENYLRCFMGMFPKEWAKWLSLAEWWYKTCTHSATKMTPYEAVYGVQPPRLLSYVSGTT